MTLARLSTPALLAVIAAALFAATPAAGQLLVSPLRQTIDPAHPRAEYEIANPSNRILVVRVRWIDLAATAEGYAPASPAHRAANSAAPFLVVSPSTLRLEPGARGRIEVRLNKSASAPAGERRSHLMIAIDAARTPIRKAGGGLEVDIGAGITTPVILRSGPAAPPTAAFGPSKLVRLEDGELALEARLQRAGAFSAYGRLEASITESGKTKRVGSLSNVALYPDAPERVVRLPLNRTVLPAGVLKVTYEGEAEFAGVLFAEKRFDIAPPE